MTMPDQLYLPRQLYAGESEDDDVAAPRIGASLGQRLLAQLIVFRTRQVRAYLKSRGYIAERIPGEPHLRYRRRYP